MNARPIFDFLRDLQKNNKKEWMDQHRDQYHEVRDDFISFLDHINRRLEEEYPQYYPTPGKKAIERINNNLMFHPSRPTYKDHFGATLDKVMKGSDYYICIGVGETGCFLGGGMWHPSREHLHSIREAIDYNGEELKRIIEDKRFKEVFGDIYREDTLKTSPQNYSQDHPHIDLLRLKSFVVIKKLTQEEVLKDDFEDRLVEYYGVVSPFFQYLRKAISV